MIQTTINIASDAHQRLQDAAEKKGVEIEEIILALMRFFARTKKKELVSWNRVQYQERCDETVWECVHVRWYGDEYEFLIDLRKIHKKSVSRLIAEAVELILDKIWSSIDIILDKNQYHQYGIAKFNVHNIVGCIFIWDVS